MSDGSFKPDARPNSRSPKNDLGTTATASTCVAADPPRDARLLGWIAELPKDIVSALRSARQNYSDSRPLIKLRRLCEASLLLLGVLLLCTLIIPDYDRALLLSGRTEVVTMRLDDPAFSNLEFKHATLRADPDRPAREGRMQLEIKPGTSVRLTRLGHGPLRLSFTIGALASNQSCGPGERSVGAIVLDGEEQPLCDVAVLVVAFKPGDDPFVIALNGEITVGEEVSQGTGARPLLLQAQASLLVKHSAGLLKAVCNIRTFGHLCERFVANTVMLSPGDAVRAIKSGSRDVEALPSLGFIRVDPDESDSGMLFDIAMPANAFQVQHVKGETFQVRESIFEVIDKSPVIAALRSIGVGLGLIWAFLRLPKAARDGLGIAAVLLPWLCVGGSARAQQALLRADEVGQAMLRSRADRCYAVTLGHVLGSESAALLTAPGRERGEADLLRRLPAALDAIVLMTATGLPLAVCPPFEGASHLDDVLRERSAATLRLVRADGSIDRLPLLVTAVDVETLEVRDEGGRLAQGMSGGTILMDDRPIGLLVDVSEEGHSGRVARLDRIFDRLAPHLAAALPALPVPAVTGKVSYEVVRWTAEPVSPANRPAALLGAGPGPWRVTANGPVDLVLKATGPMAGIVLDVTGLDDPPRFVEVLGGRSDRGPWQSLTTIALEPGDTVHTRRFPSVALPFLLLRSAASVGGRTVALGQVSILPR